MHSPQKRAKKTKKVSETEILERIQRKRRIMANGAKEASSAPAIVIDETA